MIKGSIEKKRRGYYHVNNRLYLRLRSAGVYFRVLNTPERIDVLRELGQLSKDEATFLLDAATFCRAVDHGIRILSGHAEGKLPRAESQREILAELVSRWTPIPLSSLPDIRTELRALFDRYF